MGLNQNCRLHCGLLITRVGQSVLLNSGNRWSLNSIEDFEREADEVLGDSRIEDVFLYWYNFEEGT